MADGILTELNLIDIFGYMIPGALLLAGIALPLTVPFTLPESELAGLTIAAIFAFALGLAVRGLSSHVKNLFEGLLLKQIPSASRLKDGDTSIATRLYEKLLARFADWKAAPGAPTGFEGDMWLAREYGKYEKEETSYADFSSYLVEMYPDKYGDIDNVSDYFENYLSHRHFDYEIWKLCEDCFDPPEDFKNFRALYHLVLSHLETTPYTRTFRMQALYTLSSQILVTSALLAVYYVGLLVLRFIGVSTASIRGLSTLLILFTVSVVFIISFAGLAVGFAFLWDHYAKLEFYLDRTFDSR